MSTPTPANQSSVSGRPWWVSNDRSQYFGLALSVLFLTLGCIGLFIAFKPPANSDFVQRVVEVDKTAPPAPSNDPNKGPSSDGDSVATPAPGQPVTTTAAPRPPVTRAPTTTQAPRATAAPPPTAAPTPAPAPPTTKPQSIIVDLPPAPGAASASQGQGGPTAEAQTQGNRPNNSGPSRQRSDD